MKKALMSLIVASMLISNISVVNGGLLNPARPQSTNPDFSGASTDQLIQDDGAYYARLYRAMMPVIVWLSDRCKVDFTGPGGEEAFRRTFPHFVFASDLAARKKLGYSIWGLVKFDPTKPISWFRDLIHDFWGAWMTIDNAVERQFMVDFQDVCAQVDGHSCSVDELEDMAQDFSDIVNEHIGEMLDTCQTAVDVPNPTTGIPTIVFFPPGCGTGKSKALMEMLNAIERNKEIVERLKRKERIRDANAARERNQGPHVYRSEVDGINGPFIGVPGPGEGVATNRPGSNNTPPERVCTNPVVQYNPDGTLCCIVYVPIPCS